MAEEEQEPRTEAPEEEAAPVEEAAEEEPAAAGEPAAEGEPAAPQSAKQSTQEDATTGKTKKKKKEEPPKEDKSPPNEKIFLLELVVDNINFDFCTMKRLDKVEGQLSVTYTFLKNGPLEINECDFVTKKNYSDGCESAVGIRNGKSCLFALTEKQIEEVKQEFMLDIEVHKLPLRSTHGIKEDINIGHLPINLSLLFQNLMSTVESGESLVFAKSLKDCFKIFKLEDNEIAGHLGLFIRLSCFGRLIVNNFQMNLQERCVDIKANQGHYTFKYNTKSIQPNLDGSTPPPPPQVPMLSCPCTPSCPPPICGCPPPRPPCPSHPTTPPSSKPSCFPKKSCSNKIDEILQTEVEEPEKRKSKPTGKGKKGGKKKK